VAALTTVAAATKARTDANFIMLFVSRRVRGRRTRNKENLKRVEERSVGAVNKKVL